jgi:hypothetical protein
MVVGGVDAAVGLELEEQEDGVLESRDAVGAAAAGRSFSLFSSIGSLVGWLVSWLSGWSGSEAGKGSRWEEEKGTGLWNLKCGGGAIGFREQRSPPAFLYFLVTDPGGAN